MKRFTFLLITFLFLSKPVYIFACFGPELIVGYDKNDNEAFTSVIILEQYLKEKTGINVKIVPLDKTPEKLIDEEKIDIVLMQNIKSTKLSAKNLTIDGQKKVFYRTKINEDLRFSTLSDAMDKLSKHLTLDDLKKLTTKIEREGKYRKVVKDFLIERGLW